MSRPALIVERTWQEVAEVGARYADRRVRLTILPPENDSSTTELQTEPKQTAAPLPALQLIEEGGILVLASLPVTVQDWEGLVDQARKERGGQFCLHQRRFCLTLPLWLRL